MASYLNPKPSNSIVSDLSEIRELSQYNAKADPSLGTDAPVGAKRFAKVSGGYRWEELTDNGWVEIANTSSSKLMHNVDMLDGYHVSTSAVKNTIPVYNANALLVGGITGNAATATTLKTARNIQLGGIVSSTKQSFNGSKDITIPINSITINNSTDNAVEGVLTHAHGGTGRTDGAAQDVRVSSLAGEVSAKEYGQIGRAKSLGSTHLDTLVVSGCYVGGPSPEIHTEANGYPYVLDGRVFVRVIEGAGYILQVLEHGSEIWRRVSPSSGASWYPWLPAGGTHGAGIALYVSKSGSDANTGLSAETPVLTIDRAIRIASGISSGMSNNYVTLYIGEGDLGDVTFRALPFWLDIKPYDGVAPAEYSESLPKFGTLNIQSMQVACYGLVAGTLVARWGAWISVMAGYKRMGAVVSHEESGIYFASQNAATNVWEITGDSTQSYVLNVFTDSFVFMGYLHLRLAENVSKNAFFSVAHMGRLSVYKGRTLYDASEYAFTGKKCILANAAVVTTNEDPGVATFFTDVLPGTEAEISDGVIINGWAANDSRVVHLTGDETIAGSKTFTGGVTLTGGNSPTFVVQNLDIPADGTAPSSTEYCNFRMLDAGRNIVGALAAQVYNTGAVRLFLEAKSRSGGASALLGVIAPVNGGDPYATAPTTPAGSTGTQIVTADWLYKRGLAEEIPEKANQDANLYLTTGSYWLKSTAVNIPVGSNGLLCVYSKSNVTRQVFFRQGTVNSNDYQIYTRQLADPVDGVPTVIGEWVQILTGRGGTIKSDLPRLKFSDTRAVAGTAPASTVSSGLNFNDGGGENKASLLHYVYENGGSKLELQVENWLGSGSAALGVTYGAEKGPYGYAPTPLAESNTNDIATTAWVRARSKWTYKNLIMHETPTAVGDYWLDFTSYLPNDGEEYEVLMVVNCSAATDITTNSVFRLFTPGDTLCMQVEAEGKNFEQANGSGIIPVSATRSLKFSVSGTAFDENLRIRCAGYRKA